MNDNDKRLNQIENEVRKTLGFLDDVPEISPDPFFAARVLQRVKEADANADFWLSRLLFGHRLGPALLAAILLVNMFTLFVTLSGNKARTDQRDQYIEAIADRYQLGGTYSLFEVDEE